MVLKEAKCTANRETLFVPVCKKGTVVNEN
jgi:hypothetical protein